MKDRVRNTPVRHARGGAALKTHSLIQMLDVVFAAHHKVGLLTFLKFLKMIFRPARLLWDQMKSFHHPDTHIRMQGKQRDNRQEN